MPFPELKITSMNESFDRILASQWEKHEIGLVAGRRGGLQQVVHVLGRTKRSRSLVERSMPDWWMNAKEPPTRNGTPARFSTSIASR